MSPWLRLKPALGSLYCKQSKLAHGARKFVGQDGIDCILSGQVTNLSYVLVAAEARAGSSVLQTVKVCARCAQIRRTGLYPAIPNKCVRLFRPDRGRDFRVTDRIGSCPSFGCGQRPRQASVFHFLVATPGADEVRMSSPAIGWPAARLHRLDRKESVGWKAVSADLGQHARSRRCRVSGGL